MSIAPLNAAVGLAQRGDVAVIVVDSPPVNAISQAVRAGISLALEQALADEDVKAIVLHCAGRTFCAGADISEFGKPLTEPDLNDVLRSIENAHVPVVAALHGTALGGGLELALACHYRIAAPKAKLGLPEVNLGLLPGGGGTQRTPRLIGIKAAIELIAGGKPVDAGGALALGLIDRVVNSDAILDEALAFARELIETAAPLKRARDAATDLSAEEARAAAEAYRQRHPRAFVGFKAPSHILQAVEAAADRPFEEGLVRERALFLELMDSDESAAQRHIFFAERAAAKIPGLAADTKPTDIKSAAVVGAGTMGTGIALALLGAGIAVTLIDQNPSALDRAAERVRRTISNGVDKGRFSIEAAAAQIAALTFAHNLKTAGQADLIIEAVFEHLDIKKAVFSEIDSVARPGALLASNTSFLDLNAIAESTSRPEDVVGLHFFAPADVMRLLEVVRGAKTSDRVLVSAMALGRRLGKVAIVSGVCDGFIANRLMQRRQESADRLILEGVAPWDIDRVLTAYGFPMGVFAMLDLVGLDVVGWDRENSAGRTVQEILCEAGRWGQKTGGGYYDYTAEGRAAPALATIEAIETIRAKTRTPQRAYSDEDLLHELLDPIVNEGAKVLEEGIALRASDIDMALVAGYGWPVYRGGPMFWGNTIGLEGVLARLRARRARGEAISISRWLESAAAKHGALAGLGREG